MAPDRKSCFSKEAQEDEGIRKSTEYPKHRRLTEFPSSEKKSFRAPEHTRKNPHPLMKRVFVCRYFNRPSGCDLGEDCHLLHKSLSIIEQDAMEKGARERIVRMRMQDQVLQFYVIGLYQAPPTVTSMPDYEAFDRALDIIESDEIADAESKQLKREIQEAADLKWEGKRKAIANRMAREEQGDPSMLTSSRFSSLRHSRSPYPSTLPSSAPLAKTEDQPTELPNPFTAQPMVQQHIPDFQYPMHYINGFPQMGYPPMGGHNGFPTYPMVPGQSGNQAPMWQLHATGPNAAHQGMPLNMPPMMNPYLPGFPMVRPMGHMAYAAPNPSIALTTQDDFPATNPEPTPPKPLTKLSDDTDSTRTSLDSGASNDSKTNYQPTKFTAAPWAHQRKAKTENKEEINSE